MKKPKFYTLKVKNIIRETEDAVSVEFEVPEELKSEYSYRAGQHLNFKANINGEEIRRSYSICTAQDENILRIAVKQQPYGIFSSYMNKELKVGDKLEVMTPSGVFTTDIDENTDKRFIFFAAGSGITPIISHIKTILKTAPKSTVTLVFGNKGFNDVIFKEDLEQLKNKFLTRFELVYVYSREKVGNELQEGRLDKEKIELFGETFFKGRKFDEVFVCGPKPMIFAVKEIFEAAGYDSHRIHFELFDTQQKESEQNREKEVSQNTDKVESNVTVILDDEEFYLNLSSDGKSILDAAIDAGVDAPFSCKGGVCSTCKAKVLEGEVSMDVNYALEEDEVNEGYILTCQSHPKTDKLIVSYDEW